MNDVKLKRCPFCGGKARVSFYNYRCQVICNRCHARGKPVSCNMVKGATPYQNWANELYAPYIESAIEAWNRRVSDDRQQ